VELQTRAHLATTDHDVRIKSDCNLWERRSLGGGLELSVAMQRAGGMPALPGVEEWWRCRSAFSKFTAQRFFLAKILFGVETDCSLKRMNVVHPSLQSNVWEPGENPGRLRHCNGYKFPKVPPKRIGKAGRRFEAEVRIPVWLCSSG